jgi:hypothetical protein
MLTGFQKSPKGKGRPQTWEGFCFVIFITGLNRSNSGNE